MSATRKMNRAVVRRVAAPVDYPYRCSECGFITKSRRDLGLLLTMRHRTPPYGREFCKSVTLLRESPSKP